MDAAIVPERPKARLEKKKSTPSSSQQQQQDEHSWEYVYSDLSSKGYNKDLGLRPDVLSESKKGSVRDKEEPRSRESPRRTMKEEAPPPAPRGPTEWKCNACTFLNRPDSNICSICYKSKDVVPEAPLHNHQGPECPQCTFKNFANRDYCDACGALIRPPLPVEDMV
jgi:Zn-finger in Ran binding protein and others